MPDVGTNGEIGHGMRVAFAGFTYRILDLNGFAEDVDDVETTHSGSADYRKEFKPGLVDSGECEIDVLADPDHQPPIRQRGTLVVTFPLPESKSVPASYSVAAYLKSVPIQAPIKENMMFKFKFKLSGKITRTPSS